MISGAKDPKPRNIGCEAGWPSLSLAFLAFSIRVPAWSTYLGVVERSTIIRNFVLQHDERPHVPYNTAFIQHVTPPPENDLGRLLSDAYQLTGQGRYEEVKYTYLKIIDRAKSTIHETREDDRLNGVLAQALNNLAWLHATS